MEHKTHLYHHLHCPKVSLLLQESTKKIDYNLTTPNKYKNTIQSKMLFKKEKIKIKESIFNLIKNTKKNKIKNDQKTVTNNNKKINKYISVLNDAHIDEGIVLNKYFAYVKRYNIEYINSQKQKLKNILIPIKNQEKLIKNIKKNIKFFKSISNHMLMKYMIENQEKLNQYMDEISSYKTRNSLSFNYNKGKHSIDRNISLSKTNDNKTILKTFSNNDRKRRRKIKSNYPTNKNVSNLKLIIGDSSPMKNSYSLTPFSRDKYKIKNKRKNSVNTISHKVLIDVNNNYFTPFVHTKTEKDSSENKKNNENKEKTFNRSNFQLQNYKFRSSFKE